MTYPERDAVQNSQGWCVSLCVGVCVCVCVGGGGGEHWYIRTTQLALVIHFVAKTVLQTISTVVTPTLLFILMN